MEVDGVIYIDVKPHVASKPSGRRVRQGRQQVQDARVNLADPGDENQADQARIFGNLVGDAPQRIIIGGENPSAWDKRFVPHLA